MEVKVKENTYTRLTFEDRRQLLFNKILWKKMIDEKKFKKNATIINIRGSKRLFFNKRIEHE